MLGSRSVKISMKKASSGRIRRETTTQGRAARWSVSIALFCVVANILLGGTSRNGDGLTTLAYTIDVFAIGFFLLVADRSGLAQVRPLLAFLGGLTLIACGQLIPLPPAIWIHLPGHAILRDAALVADLPQPWRPISLAPSLTMRSLLGVIPPLTLLLGAACMPRQRQFLIAWAIVGVAVFSAILGVMQFASGGSPALYFYAPGLHDYSVGVFTNRNHQAAFLALSVSLLRSVLSTSLSTSRRPYIVEYCFWPVALVIISAVIVTGSRTGLGLSILGLFAAMLIVKPSMPTLHGVPGGRYAIIMLPLIVAAAIILIFISFGRAASIDRLLDTSGYQGELRFAFWPIILREVWHFLPLGSGLGTFDTVFRLYEPDWALKSTFFNHAHSDPLEWVLTTGVAGVLLLTGFVIWLVHAVRDVLVRDRGSNRRLLAQSAIVGILILTLASLPDYPLRTPALSAVFAALLAFICVTHAPQSLIRSGRDGQD